jgi:hypothetical protein
MTKKLFLVGSSIETRPGKFTYSNTRSLFSNEERLRQTFSTINSIHCSFPDSKIVLLDSSDNYLKYKQILTIVSNLEYIPLKELSQEAFELSNTHEHKSICEAVMVNAYYRTFKKELLEYDYIIKACGRYIYFNFNDKYFTEKNKDKIFYKKPCKFEWQDFWNYELIDRREIQKDNKLNQYCPILYAFGSMHLDKFIDMNEALIHLLSIPKMKIFDIEVLSYYMTRPFENNIIETDWIVSGWDGVNGNLWYY